MSNKKSTESLVIKNNDKIKTESSEKITLKEFEKMVIDFAKKGLTSEKIGEELRQQGIHPQEYEKTISKILKEKNAYVAPDLKNVETKLQRIENHIKNNNKDKRAIREKSRVFSQIKRIKEYNQIAQ